MFRSPIQSKLDAQIISALDELDKLEPNSEKYDVAVERVSKLYKLKTEGQPRPKPLSLDTVLVVGANVFGILWLARYERENVVKAQNAFRMILKP